MQLMLTMQTVWRLMLVVLLAFQPHSKRQLLMLMMRTVWLDIFVLLVFLAFIKARKICS